MNIVGRDSGANSYAQGESLGCIATGNETYFCNERARLVKYQLKIVGKCTSKMERIMPVVVRSLNAREVERNHNMPTLMC